MILYKFELNQRVCKGSGFRKHKASLGSVGKKKKNQVCTSYDKPLQLAHHRLIQIKHFNLIRGKQVRYALSMPSWFTAFTNSWCSSTDQITRGFFDALLLSPPSSSSSSISIETLLGTCTSGKVDRRGPSITHSVYERRNSSVDLGRCDNPIDEQDGISDRWSQHASLRTLTDMLWRAWAMSVRKGQPTQFSFRPRTQKKGRLARCNRNDHGISMCRFWGECMIDTL